MKPDHGNGLEAPEPVAWTHSYWEGEFGTACCNIALVLGALDLETFRIACDLYCQLGALKSITHIYIYWCS